MAVSPDGKMAAAGSADCSIRLYDLRTAKVVFRLRNGASSLLAGAEAVLWPRAPGDLTGFCRFGPDCLVFGGFNCLFVERCRWTQVHITVNNSLFRI